MAQLFGCRTYFGTAHLATDDLALIRFFKTTNSTTHSNNLILHEIFYRDQIDREITQSNSVCIIWNGGKRDSRDILNLNALKRIIVIKLRFFIVSSDFKSVWQSSMGFIETHPLVLEILQCFLFLVEHSHQVEFCLLPAHVNYHGNETADRLAK